MCARRIRIRDFEICRERTLVRDSQIQEEGGLMEDLEARWERRWERVREALWRRVVCRMGSRARLRRRWHVRLVCRRSGRSRWVRIVCRSSGGRWVRRSSCGIGVGVGCSAMGCRFVENEVVVRVCVDQVALLAVVSFEDPSGRSKSVS